ncbi:hypothetical protein BRE01_62510 [Brevibacillus reuszeri]|nr:hypothetical protein [Brevibacillus reuszeri]GED72549.1 hypothetical protein BRE01_62510 [Brevibacillus reuszeri]
MPWKQMRTWYVDKRNPDRLHNSIREMFEYVGEDRPSNGKLPDWVYSVDAMNVEVAKKKLTKEGFKII